MLHVAMALGFVALGAVPGDAQNRPGGSAQANAEDEYYRIVTIPVPEDVVLEVGGMAALPGGGLAVATRRGEVWTIENPYMEGGSSPHYTRFAQGLHEPLGLAYRDGALLTSQRSELTRLIDRDGDGRADRYETVYSWPLSGNYHEYSYGPVFTPQGNMLVTLNLAWVDYGASLAKWRGWAIEITPDGEMTPLATGLRSPAGYGYNLAGDLFYAENQGDWVGSGGITHLERGDFAGNPAGLIWTDEPESPLKLRPEDIPDTGEPEYVVAQRVPGMKPPAVWFPHIELGISTSDILVDSMGGRFGPFAGQLLVADQGQSRIMRVFLEEVDGVYQGVVFPFREGFSSGILRMEWGRDASLFVGMTSRGWASTGRSPYGLQRLVWTGEIPFEAQKVEARPDGVEITFTQPVDPRTAGDPASYAVEGFIYQFHHTYGSPTVDQRTHPVRRVQLSEDGLRARIEVEGMRLGYVHQIAMAGVRSAEGAPLLHDTGYFTLNRIPAGAPMAADAGAAGVRSAAGPASGMTADGAGGVASGEVGAVSAAGSAGAGAKRMTSPPAAWNGQIDRTVTIRTEPGLRFDLPEVVVGAGERVQLVLVNGDDMLHNLLVVRPSAVERVVHAATTLGLRGMEMQFVPDDPDVLFHTALLQPNSEEAVYFVAPPAGRYAYVCTFPGHGVTMRGELIVR